MDSFRILIVEDNLIEATEVRQTLEKAGHTVTAIARTLAEAIASIQYAAPDVALIDIQLDGSPTDGIGTAQALQRLRPIPVLYLTASSEYDTFRRAKETLPAAYLLKPFNRAELAFQIELACYHHQINALTMPGITQTDDLYLPVDKGHERVAKSNVVLLQAAGSYVNVFLADAARPRLLSMNLGYLSQFFTAPHFYRLSRSMLINLRHLERLEQHQVYLKNQEKPLPLPQKNRPELVKRLNMVRTR